MIKAILIATAVLRIAVANTEEMPFTAKPGQCFTKAFYPPKYTKSMKIKSTKKILLNDESVKYEVIPAKYSWHEERVKISDGTEKIVTTPSVYKTVYERVLIESASKVWRKTLNTNASKSFSSCVQSALASGMDIENARVGTCFYEHYSSERYVSTTSKILASEASERIVVIPAKYQTRTKKIMTDTTSLKLLPSIAVYKKVKDRVIIEPARTEWQKTICNNRGCNQSEVVCLTEVPQTYKEVTKRIVLQPAVMKKVAVSPTYKTVEIQEMVEPARSEIVVIPPKYQTFATKEKVEEAKYYWSDASEKNAPTRLKSQCNKICLTATPAEYKTIARRIIVTPASSKKITTPAKYTIVKVKRIEEDASFKKVVIPKEYITVITQQERTKGFAKWMPMVCESNMTPTIIRKVQEALKLQGFYQGQLNGIWNIESKSAGRAYQKENGLAVTNKLSIETMKALEIY